MAGLPVCDLPRSFFPREMVLLGLLVEKGESQNLSDWCLPYPCTRCGSVCLHQDWVEKGGEHSCARDPPKRFYLHSSTDYGFLLGLRSGGFSPGKVRPTLSCAKQHGASLLTSSKFIPQNQLRCSIFVGDTVILYLFFIYQSAGLLTASLWGEKAGAASPELDASCCCGSMQRRKIFFLSCLSRQLCSLKYHLLYTSNCLAL